MTTYATIHRITNIKIRKKTISKKDSPHGQSYEVIDLYFYDDKGKEIMELAVFGDYNGEVIVEGTL